MIAGTIKSVYDFVLWRWFRTVPLPDDEEVLGRDRLSAHRCRPPERRARYLEWIADGRAVREAHGILAEWVLDPPAATATRWWSRCGRSHEIFDAWIATPSATRSPHPRSTAQSTTDRSPATTSSAATPPRRLPEEVIP